MSWPPPASPVCLCPACCHSMWCVHAQQYNLWCDDGNYGTYTYGWYGRNVSFPRNFWYAAAQQRHVKRSLMALFGASDLSLVKESVSVGWNQAEVVPLSFCFLSTPLFLLKLKLVLHLYCWGRGLNSF